MPSPGYFLKIEISIQLNYKHYTPYSDLEASESKFVSWKNPNEKKAALSLIFLVTRPGLVWVL